MLRVLLQTVSEAKVINTVMTTVMNPSTMTLMPDILQMIVHLSRTTSRSMRANCAWTNVK